MEEQVNQQNEHFLWLAAQDKLLTNLARFKRNLTTNSLCSPCNREEEDVLHILRDCDCAVNIWNEILQPQDLQEFNAITDDRWFEDNLWSQFHIKLNQAVFTATI